MSAPYFNANYPAKSSKRDMLIAKLSATGDILWSKTFLSRLGTTCAVLSIQLRDVAEGQNGELFFTGFHMNCPSPMYMIVFRTNSNGVEQQQYYVIYRGRLSYNGYECSCREAELKNIPLIKADPILPVLV